MAEIYAVREACLRSFRVQSQTILQCTQCIEGNVDNLGFIIVIMRICQQLSGSDDQYSPGFLDARWQLARVRLEQRSFVPYVPASDEFAILIPALCDLLHLAQQVNSIR